jgi:hypothetical protein
MMRVRLRHVKDKTILVRATKIALLVGTALTLVNYYGSILLGTLSVGEEIQIIITYLVPFSVATYVAAAQSNHIRMRTGRQEVQRVGSGG